MRLAVMKHTRNATLLLVFAVLLVVCGRMLWPQSQAPEPGASSMTTQWQQASISNPFAKGAEQSMPLPWLDAPTTPAPDLAKTSLAGTQADGDWGVNAQGRVQPSRALRQRFDYYLSLIGEMPLASIQSLLQQAAQGSLKEPALSQVMAIWVRYVQLQQYEWKHAVIPQQSASWGAALSERQIVRRQILGADVAYAFYQEEESQFANLLTQVQSGKTGLGAAAAPAPPQAALHPQASEREAAVQADWQQWELRINSAREQLRQLTLAPELSAIQRQQAIERYLLSQFQGTELIRARSLLGV